MKAFPGLVGLVSAVSGLMGVASAAPKTVDEVTLKAAMDQLLVTAAGPSDLGTRFLVVKITGSSIKEMLESYAVESKNHEPTEVVILTRSTAADLPTSDDGKDIVALAKNTDAAGYAADVYFSETNKVKLNALVKSAQSALFKVTTSGAFVGIESSGWSVCGTQFPALFILNPALKQVFSLVPSDTEC